MPFLPLLEKLAEKLVLYGVLSLLNLICANTIYGQLLRASLVAEIKDEHLGISCVQLQASPWM